MEPTTQSPPAPPDQSPPEQTENRNKPLPSTERDFRARPSRTASPGFRIALIIGVVVLLVVGFFVYRYVNSVSARVSGHVVKLNVDDNQNVQAGAVLVEIDPADYQVAYQRAKAN